MQKFTPCLWFDTNAVEAVNFYLSVFGKSKLIGTSLYPEGAPGEKGTVMMVAFVLEDQHFLALNGGPVFKITPAISFFVTCKSDEEINDLWKKLSEKGTALMPLNAYLFSKKFGWVQDKFGVSWQLTLSESKQKITPFLLFVGAQHGKTEEAIKFYTSVFKKSDILNITYREQGDNEKQKTINHAVFSLDRMQFMAMDGGLVHQFTFTPAISLMVNCKNQKEIDSYWEKLSNGGQKNVCGWLTDKYGVSWQVVPESLEKMVLDKGIKKSNNVVNAVLKMSKLDLSKLKEAYNQK